MIAFGLLMGISVILSSVKLQNFIREMDFTATAGDPFSALSPEDQERRRVERNRVFRYYPAEERTYPIPSDICGTGPEFNKYFDEQDFNRKALNEEDKILNNLFSSALQDTGSSGTYLEIGAYNGRAESNTRFFQECYGWKGLLIEGNPKIYQALARNRPLDHRMAFSPTCTLAEEFMNKTVPFHNVDATTAGIEGVAILHMGKQYVKLPCGSLTRILLELFPEGHIDFFSLDVENSEADVLEHLDFRPLFIEIILVENISKICDEKCEVRDRVRKRLRDLGYALYPNVVASSNLFIHPDSKYQLPNGYKTIEVEDFILKGTS